MNSIEVLKNIYKPYRYTIKGKSTIIETSSGNFVIKEKKKELKELYNYLITRDFDNFPKIIDESRKDVNLYEYLENNIMPDEQRGVDLVKLVANLHNKTVYYKEVSGDKYKEIYENIKSNIDYLKNYYNNCYNSFFKEVYSSPSHYLFISNYYKLNGALNFCESELNEWFDIVKENNKERVSILHNNLSVDHYIKADRDYLISWDNFKIDSPVLDIVKYYQNDNLRIDFKNLWETYKNRFPLLKSEEKLFFILVSIPDKIEFNNSEFVNIKNIRKSFDKLYKSEELTRPYYSSQNEEENTNLDY